MKVPGSFIPVPDQSPNVLNSEGCLDLMKGKCVSCRKLRSWFCYYLVVFFPLDLSLSFFFFFFFLCFCCPKIVSVTIHFGRLSGQIGYISCEVVSFFPSITPILVAVCLAFRVKGNLHV